MTLLPLAACLLVMTLVSPRRVQAAPGRPNVLFMIADDLNTSLGSYGHPRVRTPNLDRLARRGVLFTRAYAQYPLCSPSRTSMLTGLRPHRTKITDNPPGRGSPYRGHFRSTIPDVVTLPQLFRRHGYFAARVGKVFHYGVPGDIGTGGLDDYGSWDLALNPRGRDRDDEARTFSLAPGAPTTSGRFGGTLSWLAADGRDEQQTDGMVANEAIELLERFAERRTPFFLAVGFFRPHTPFVAPKRYFRNYPLGSISPGQPGPGDEGRWPALAYASSKSVNDAMDDDLRRRAVQAYYASVSFVDAQAGRVLDALRRAGLERDTIVVFTSDHGYLLGEHGLWQKQSLFEGATRVPLIMAGPGARRGAVAEGPAELVDLYPTLAELCGLEAPELDGNSLVPVLADPSRRVKDAAFSEIVHGTKGRGRAVRTERWRYVEWNDGVAGQQLFDMDDDPQEQRNLAADPAHATLVHELRAALQRTWSTRPVEAAAARTN